MSNSAAVDSSTNGPIAVDEQQAPATDGAGPALANVVANAGAVRTIDSIEQLSKEAEELRFKLEQERQKMNDISIQQAAEHLDQLPSLGVKQRKHLKGHMSKVLCMDWSQVVVFIC